MFGIPSPSMSAGSKVAACAGNAYAIKTNARHLKNIESFCVETMAGYDGKATISPAQGKQQNHDSETEKLPL